MSTISVPSTAVPARGLRRQATLQVAAMAVLVVTAAVYLLRRPEPARV